MKNNDQSKAKHGAVLENLKGKKIQKARATGLRARQDRDTKQKAGNSLMKILHFVRNDKITASQKYKILVVAFFFFFFFKCKYITAVFPTGHSYKSPSNPV